MTFTLPPALTDKLSAVNVLLSSIGESPVSSIEGEAAEAASASNILDEISLAVQNRGWPWNRDYQVFLEPDNTARIALPANGLRVAKAYPGNHSGSLVERGRFIYDNRRSSYVFDEGVIVDLITKLSFDEMPEAARRYITIRAAQQYQGRVQTSSAVDRVLDGEVASALVVLEQEVDEVEQNNCISGNAETSYRINGRGAPRRRY